MQRFALEICRELRKQSVNFQLLAPNDIYNQDLFKELKPKIVGITTGHLWEKTELPLFLKTNKSPLLINLCNSAPLFYRNQIIALHDMAVFENANWFSKKFVLFYKIVLPIMARNAKKIITVSDFSMGEIQKYLNLRKDKIEVIYNGIDHFDSSSNTFPNKYGKYLLCVGSVEPRKNLLNVLKAFQLLDLPEFKLIIVGGKNQLFKSLDFNKLISDDFIERIIFTGYVSDDELKGLYYNSSTFLYPSFYEGFGIPPLEAMKLGCPTIVSNNSSLPEICGNASLYVNPKDSEDLSNKIQYLLKNEDIRKELILKGEKQILKYSWQKSAKKLLSVINENI